MAWAAVVLAVLLSANFAVVVATLLVASAFTLLLLAHLAVLAARTFRADVSQKGAQRPDGETLNRRRFVWLGLKAAAGTAFLIVGGRLATDARARGPGQQHDGDFDDEEAGEHGGADGDVDARHGPCHCVIPDDLTAFTFFDPVNNERSVCIAVNGQFPGTVGCFGDCPGENPPPCIQQVTCKWDKGKTKATKGGHIRFPKKDSDCCITLVAEQCPVKAHLEVEITVKCFCGRTPVAGAGGTCTKVVKADVSIDCCCPKVEHKIQRGDSTTSGGLRVVQWTANANFPDCLKNCAGLGGALGNCDRKDLKCEWSVIPGSGPDANLGIVGAKDNCAAVTVKSTPGKKYQVCRTVTFKCACGLDFTVCEDKDCKEGP